MRPRRRPPPPSPAPAPSPASRSRDVSSPPSPYAALAPGPGPGPAPEPSAAAVAGGGRRGGASLSPPLIAMLAVVGAALLVVLYARLVSRVFRAARRRWRRRRLRLLMLPGGGGGGSSPSLRGGGDDSFASFTTYDNYYHTFSPYCGLDESAIKSLPSAQYLAAAAARGSGASRECAVCLLEFADGDELRALPLCAHAFHADCIDVWLRAHASCPLCRAAVALPPPVPSPLHRGARRVRPSLDDLLFFHPVPPLPSDGATGAGAAAHEIAPASPDQLGGARDFLLKRSYSFGFERSLAVEAASTASPPWRFRLSAAAAADGAATSRGRSFWSKRWPSPFGGGGGGGGSAAGSAAARVFSFRSYRSAAGKSSPFSRRRAHGAGSGFFMSLASEPPSILAAARRSRAAAASSRLRCGDPEALLSPDRLSR
ncbi:hypothetical protein SETIT_3G374600v2 [Setaria italica]|uniref:RING-type E3 ubiquitin transferase n=2 Tax=Setaria italica TaxID=4555 RepID=A0A368QMV6_SETIT|nr:RING-H2 finger protein ATL65 [Setaria italica]RCV19315.1 hypothetical protein SETIT_3G374600v2 [Setaria italica]